MRKLISILLSGITGFLFVYLMSAFYSVSFDISNWEIYVRLVTIIMGVYLAIIFSIFNIYDFKTK